MKIGDIKIEALKLMFVNYSFDLGIDDLPRLTADENYGSYIVNMDGSISRGIDRIQNACVVPLKSYPISDEELFSGRSRNRFDLKQIEDFFLLDRIIAEGAGDYYEGNAEYQLEGDMLALKGGYDYTVLYYPKLKAIDDTVGDMDNIWLPDHLARLLPYFVKSELYQEEEPNAAQEARNLFEMSLDDLKQSRHSNQTRVQRVI